MFESSAERAPGPPFRKGRCKIPSHCLIRNGSCSRNAIQIRNGSFRDPPFGRQTRVQIPRCDACLLSLHSPSRTQFAGLCVGKRGPRSKSPTLLACILSPLNLSYLVRSDLNKFSCTWPTSRNPIARIVAGSSILRSSRTMLNGMHGYVVPPRNGWYRLYDYRAHLISSDTFATFRAEHVLPLSPMWPTRPDIKSRIARPSRAGDLAYLLVEGVIDAVIYQVRRCVLIMLHLAAWTHKSVLLTWRGLSGLIRAC